MNTEIELTESLSFYVEKRVNTHAVEQVMEINPKKAYTVGMSWEEIEALNQARLAALKVKTDYWSLMNEVWNLTWGHALTETLPGTHEVKAEEYDDERSLEYVWDEYFYRQYQVNGSVLVLCVNFDTNTEYLELRFYLDSAGEGDYEQSNRLVLSDTWVPEPEEDERVTRKYLLQIQGMETIDVAPLVQAAREAMEKLIVQAGVGQLTS